MVKINRNSDNQLIDSYMRGDFNLFSQLIKDGENVNCLNHENNSLISLVVENSNKLKNNKKFFDLLISNGVSLKQIGWEKDLLSICVIHQNDLYYAKKLLKNKIDINAKGVCRKYNYNTDGYLSVRFGPPIFDSIRMGKQKYFNLFLENNADVGVIDNYGNTALHILINKSNGKYFEWDEKEIFEILLTRGADPNIRSNDDMDTLNSIIFNEKNHLFPILFRKSKDININSRDCVSRTPLMNSIISDMPKLTKRLIKKQANLDTYDFYENNALVYCIRSQKFDLFKLIIENGANIKSINRLGNNILHHIADLERFLLDDDSNNNEFSEVILNKHPELLMQKNIAQKTPLDMFKKHESYETRNKDFLKKFKNKIKSKETSR